MTILGQITLDSIANGLAYIYIASPNGVRSYPAVLYNHGGLDTVVGGDFLHYLASGEGACNKNDYWLMLSITWRIA